MIGIPSMYCIDNSLIVFEGDYYSPVYNYLVIKLEKCSETDTLICKDELEMNAFFRKQSLDLVLINSYVDYEDFTTRDLSKTTEGCSN